MLRRLCDPHDQPGRDHHRLEQRCDLAICYALKCTLERNGHTVTTFESSHAAWDALRDNKYDVLITDIVFPPGQAHGVALSQHARARNSRIKVIFMTGFADLMNEVGGPDDVAFIKPFDLEKLVLMVNSQFTLEN